MKKSGSKTFAKKLKRLKSAGAWAVRPNCTALFVEKLSDTLNPRSSFIVHRSIKTVTKKHI